MKTALQGLVGLVLAILLLYWVFHDKDPQAIAQALRHASWPALCLAAAINLGHNVFRVARWRDLLAPVRERVPFRPLFTAVILGYMTTWLIPGRVGEIVRPALLSARERLPLGPCLGSVVADRLLDGVAIVVLFAVGSIGARFAAGAAALTAEIRATAVFALVVLVALLAVFIAVSAAGARLERWLSGRWAPLRWLGHAALGLAKGADALRSPGRLLPIAIHSLLAWATVGLGTWIGVRAAGADVGYQDVLVMLPLLALGVAIPTPGGVGGYHALMQIGLTSLFGVDPTVAAGAGLLMHLAIVLPVLVLGGVLLYTERIAWSDLVAAAKQVKDLGQATAVTEAAR